MSIIAISWVFSIIIFVLAYSTYKIYSILKHWDSISLLGAEFANPYKLGKHLPAHFFVL